jgi:transposase
MTTLVDPIRSGHVVVGVDTHKHIHVAAVMDTIGGILATLTIATDTGGFKQLLEWAASFGRVLAFGVEGTGSYGATLTSFLRRHGHKVVEAGRADRRLRRANGKSDTLDAENAARSVLAGFATAIPKTADGTVEMIRQLKIAHDSAVTDRTAAMVTMKAVLVHASDELRRDTNRMTQIKLVLDSNRRFGDRYRSRSRHLRRMPHRSPTAGYPGPKEDVGSRHQLLLRLQSGNRSPKLQCHRVEIDPVDLGDRGSHQHVDDRCR